MLNLLCGKFGRSLLLPSGDSLGVLPQPVVLSPRASVGIHPRPVPVARQRPAFGYHVLHILLVSTKPQMIRSPAGGVVPSRAIVAHQQTGRDWPYQVHIGESVDDVSFPVERDKPIAVFVGSELPEPTLPRPIGAFRQVMLELFWGILGLRHLRLLYRLRVSPCRGCDQQRPALWCPQVYQIPRQKAKNAKHLIAHRVPLYCDVLGVSARKVA